jgi:hypothetical protein
MNVSKVLYYSVTNIWSSIRTYVLPWTWIAFKTGTEMTLKLQWSKYDLRWGLHYSNKNHWNHQFLNVTYMKIIAWNKAFPPCLPHDEWFMTSCYCFPVTFCTNCIYSVVLKVISWTHPVVLTPVSEKVCIPELVNSLPPSNFNHWEMDITWHSLTFLISWLACFIIYCVSWFVNGCTMQYFPLLVTQIFPAPKLLGWRCHRIQLRVHILKLCPPSNICFVLVSTICRILKLPNYGNDMEELGFKQEAWNNMWKSGIGG